MPDRLFFTSWSGTKSRWVDKLGSMTKMCVDWIELLPLAELLRQPQAGGFSWKAHAYAQGNRHTSSGPESGRGKPNDHLCVCKVLKEKKKNKVSNTIRCGFDVRRMTKVPTAVHKFCSGGQIWCILSPEKLLPPNTWYSPCKYPVAARLNNKPYVFLTRQWHIDSPSELKADSLTASVRWWITDERSRSETDESHFNIHA